MKTLVVFYSRSGTTKRVAQEIAKALNADVDEVIDKKSRRGILGFLRAGYDATRGKTTEIEFEKDPSEYDFVIIGTSVWNGRVTPAIRTYLLQNKDKIKNAAFFCTCEGRAGKCLEQMEELLEKKPVLKKILMRKKLDEGIKELMEELET
ncbi:MULTISPECIES: flavodoxin [Thermococcus]|uniref:Flavodoxin, FldA n=1 Tax=Thermococcus sibiricus (strain DSM 12597 / MM 739) TaxID=604354 RepID=C6A582_THESM|nr:MULTISPECIES: flavodoxin [Thermococcus]ACS90777.1 Flavodoxin, FldA [Thermococcus sibiricus MM 739]MBC7094201.1 flavodoxin [Thermococcus sp.]